MLIRPTTDPTKLKKDGSNTDSDIDIGSHKLTAEGLVIGDAKVPFVLTASISSSGTTHIYSGNAPVAFRIIDCWSVNTVAVAGAWKLSDGINDITSWFDTRAYDYNIKTANNEAINVDYHEIPVNGTLDIINDSKLPASCIVYILCMRV